MSFQSRCLGFEMKKIFTLTIPASGMHATFRRLFDAILLYLHKPVKPTKEKWGAAGGRLYVTCLNTLMLEVYYRHLPLYLELER